MKNLDALCTHANMPSKKHFPKMFAKNSRNLFSSYKLQENILIPAMRKRFSHWCWRSLARSP
ncbi:hypothetical protein, partial [Agathobaculum sp.]|uniref:hypothetical protein n=1 Tax=Agathobaculum sp. TaxID=2048138 RepID=UPI0027BA28ED